MIVLSLFDGISCGQLALKRAGINPNVYFASEIESSAIEITQNNFPNTIQLGDVTKINFENLTGGVDLLLGGSPCQDLSNAKADRKGLEGEKSSLFFYYLKALRTIKPRYYLLENNYSMSKENQEIITNLLKETYPNTTCTMINSKLVSAQSRKRLYWTNIPNVTQPEDKNIYLQDILEYGYADRDKALCLARRYAGFTGSQSYMCRRYFTKSFGTGVFTSKEDRDYIKNKLEENSYFKDEELEHKIIRPLTCTECERLQTLPDGYTDCIKSEIKRKEAIGNAWTVDVITHILKGITNETTNRTTTNQTQM